MKTRAERLETRMLGVVLLVLWCASLSPGSAEVRSYHMMVNASDVIQDLNHFWESTGFCPPEPHQADADWMLSQDMQHNLAYIGAVPLKGIKQVRIHWLLDLIKIDRLKSDGSPVYNYTNLDNLLGILWSQGLKPGFEIMGNPSSFFTDLENKTQAYLWKDLVSQIAHRYVGQFGLGYVSTWNFETWNEPEGHDFDKLKFTAQGYRNYFDACYEGLMSVSTSLVLGTPGGNCLIKNKDGLDYVVLDHVAHGRSMFTGKPLSVDYISCHRKGEEPDNAATLMKKERQVFDDIHSTFPTLATVPLFNDEADPLVGWSHERWWRADATYAAMVVKIIAQHQRLLIPDKKYNYRLLSNDNGFLSYNPHFFTQRTLVARFQMNMTHPHHVQFIRKPILSVMGLLSLIGEKEVNTQISDEGGQSVGTMAEFGAIAGVHLPAESQQESWELSVIIYNSKDSWNVTSQSQVQVKVKDIPDEVIHADLALALYMLSNTQGNPYSVWLAAGKPAQPSRKLLQEMRDAQEPVRVKGPGPYNPAVNDGITFTLPLPGVSLIHICAKPPQAPDQVPSVTVQNITYNQVLVTWEDSCVHARCIKTYEVEFSQNSDSGPYTRINKLDTVFTVFVYAPETNSDRGLEKEMVQGYYRVRAVDYWDRPGAYSLPVKY